MHTSIKLETPCEFVNVTPVNPLISKCQIKVCYVGDDANRNGSIISKETALKMANSLPGSPIVGFFNENTGDFEGHNQQIEVHNGDWVFKDTTKPYGFVDLNAKVWFQKFLDDGVNEHEYLMTEGWLWTGQYPECQRIMAWGNNQSMELDEGTIQGSWSEDENGYPEFFIINEAIISKLCILGENTEPCFEGASISKVQFSFDDGFKAEMRQMMSELKELLSEGGTKVPTEEKLETEFEVVEEVVEEIAPEAEAEVQDETIQSEPSDTEEVVEEVPVEEPAEEVVEETVEEEPAAEEEQPVAYSLDEIPEYVDLMGRFSELEHSYNALIETNNTLSQELTSLREFKHAFEKKEKQAMIDSFYMLSDEDKQDVVDNIDTYSVGEIEAKLSVICFRNKVSFDNGEQENEVSGNTVFNLNEGMNEAIPAWVQATLDTQKTHKL